MVPLYSREGLYLITAGIARDFQQCQQSVAIRDTEAGPALNKQLTYPSTSLTQRDIVTTLDRARGFDLSIGLAAQAKLG